MLRHRPRDVVVERRARRSMRAPVPSVPALDRNLRTRRRVVRVASRHVHAHPTPRAGEEPIVALRLVCSRASQREVLVAPLALRRLVLAHRLVRFHFPPREDDAARVDAIRTVACGIRSAGVVYEPADDLLVRARLQVRVRVDSFPSPRALLRRAFERSLVAQLGVIFRIPSHYLTMTPGVDAGHGSSIALRPVVLNLASANPHRAALRGVRVVREAADRDLVRAVLLRRFPVHEPPLVRAPAAVEPPQQPAVPVFRRPERVAAQHAKPGYRARRLRVIRRVLTDRDTLRGAQTVSTDDATAVGAAIGEVDDGLPRDVFAQVTQHARRRRRRERGRSFHPFRVVSREIARVHETGASSIVVVFSLRGGVATTPRRGELAQRELVSVPLRLRFP
eukprot:30942-Pelagococcus_subviridis.AAC.25